MLALKQREEGEGRWANNVEVPTRVRKHAEKLEMNVFQINSQRFFGPSLFLADGWEPEKGSEVFISKIPRDYLEPDLLPFLEQVGPIFQIRLMMDFSGTNKGYGFVLYYSQEQANLAVNALHNKSIKPHYPVVVRKSVDNQRLVLSGFPTTKSEEEIEEAIRMNTGGVQKIALTWDVKDPGPGKGIVFVTYDSHRSAALARKKVLHTPLIVWDSIITAEWAEPLRPVSPFIYRDQVLLVQNIHPRIRLQTLWETFDRGQFSGVEDIRLFRRQRQATVYFATRAQAEVSKMVLNGINLRGSKIQVTWCDPENVPPLHFDPWRSTLKHAYSYYARECTTTMCGSGRQNHIAEQVNDRIRGRRGRGRMNYSRFPTPIPDIQAGGDQGSHAGHGMWHTQPTPANFQNPQFFSYQGNAWNPEMNGTAGGYLPPAPYFGHQYLQEACDYANNEYYDPIGLVEVTESGQPIVGGNELGAFYENQYYQNPHPLTYAAQPFPLGPAQDQTIPPFYNAPQQPIALFGTWINYNNVFNMNSVQSYNQNYMPTMNDFNNVTFNLDGLDQQFATYFNL